MKYTWSKFKKASRKAVAAFMIVWLSSVLVLLCCGTDIFASNGIETGETCPMAKKHDCCKKNTDNATVGQKHHNSSCVFSPQKTLSGDLKTVKIVKYAVVLASSNLYLKSLPIAIAPNRNPHFKVSRNHNRGRPYLLNCSFRI